MESNKYINVQEEFEIDYPKEWNCIENFFGSIVVFKDSNEYPANVSIVKYLNHSNISVENLANNTVNELSNYLTNLSIESIINIDENNVKLVYYGTSMPDNVDISFWQYLRTNKRKVYSLTCGSPSAGFNDHVATFSYMYHSWVQKA